jgi:RNA polymerase sigma factor (sigma-70 family)
MRNAMSEPPSDQQLLETFARDRSSDAFRALADRHAAWVFASAYRQLRDQHLAEDATQIVFILLARKGGACVLSHHKLTGWLFNTLHFTVRNLKRARIRRQLLETRAAVDRPQIETPDEPEELLAELDIAVSRLSDADRTAILLRFYQDLSYEQIAAALGISEPAARKRVSRATELLRQRLGVAGRTASVTAIAAAAVYGTSHTPATLAATVSSVAVGSVASAGIPASLTAALKGTVSLMAVSKLQTAAIALAIAALVSIPSVYLVSRIVGAATPATAPTVEGPAGGAGEAGGLASPSDELAKQIVSTYALGPDQVCKLVTDAPPPVRAGMWNALQFPAAQGRQPPSGPFIFDWNNGSPQNPVVLSDIGARMTSAQAIGYLCMLIFDTDKLDIRTPLPTDTFTLAGDLVYTHTLSRDRALPLLESAVERTFHASVKLSCADIQESVYVFRGQWNFKRVGFDETRQPPMIGPNVADPLVEIFGGDKFDALAPQVGSGIMDRRGLAVQIGQWIDQPVEIHADGVPPAIGWRYTGPTVDTPAAQKVAHDPISVLNHITDQTGLKWTQETRTVPQVVIEPKPPAPQTTQPG